MYMTHPVTYAIVSAELADPVKEIHGEFYGFHVQSGTGTLTVEDGGVLIYSSALTNGQTVTFGGCGIIFKSGILASVSGSAIVTIFYS